VLDHGEDLVKSATKSVRPATEKARRPCVLRR